MAGWPGSTGSSSSRIATSTEAGSGGSINLWGVTRTFPFLGKRSYQQVSNPYGPGETTYVLRFALTDDRLLLQVPGYSYFSELAADATIWEDAFEGEAIVIT